MNALIIDESFKGCGLVVIKNDEFIIGRILYARVGQLGPLLCKIKWMREGDDKLVRLGIEYLED